MFRNKILIVKYQIFLNNILKNNKYNNKIIIKIFNYN